MTGQGEGENRQSPDKDRPALRRAPGGIKWDKLTPCERDALTDVCKLLHAATETTSHTSEECCQRSSTGERLERPLTTSFLVTGPRGCGKTTTLVNAKYATQFPDRFFQKQDKASSKDDESAQPASTEEIDLTEECRSIALSLKKSLHWLPLLDIDLLPERANLLTTLLVHVQQALDSNKRHLLSELQDQRPYGHGMPSYLLGEGLDDIWVKFDDLIRTATMMWGPQAGGSGGTDQWVDSIINSTETHASFGEDVRRTLHALVGYVDPTGERTNRHSLALVLPIDNADRNVHYLFQLVRLLSLVHSPHLYFLLAANRSTLEAFFERSLRKELGVEASSNDMPDELLAIGRRQSRTALSTLLPPSHRVTIGPLTPKDAMGFSADARGTLQKRLSNATLYCVHRKSCQSLACPESLLDFFPSDQRRDTATGSPEGNNGVAHTGNASSTEDSGDGADSASDNEYSTVESLVIAPVRQVLSLWELTPANLAAEVDKAAAASQRRNTRPVQIVYRMLRDAIDDSDLPEWAVNVLKSRILLSDEQSRIHIDNHDSLLKRITASRVRHVLPLNDDDIQRAAGAETEIIIYQYPRQVLQLTQRAPNTREHPIELPPDVGGWLMVLYDLLAIPPSDMLVGEDRSTIASQVPIVVATRHRFCAGGRRFEVTLPWPMPQYSTFFDVDGVIARWNALSKKILTADLSPHPSEWVVRAIACAWIDAVNVVWDNESWELRNPRHNSVVVGHKQRANPLLQNAWPPRIPKDTPTLLSAYEGEVKDSIQRSACWIRQKPSWACLNRMRPFQEWLGVELPRLLSPEYLGCAVPESICDAMDIPAPDGARTNPEETWPQPTRQQLRDLRLADQWRNLRERVRSCEFSDLKSNRDLTPQGNTADALLSRITRIMLKAVAGEERATAFRRYAESKSELEPPPKTDLHTSDGSADGHPQEIA